MSVDFSELNQDLQTRAASRLLTQFKRSPVLLQLLHALVAEVQALSDAIVDVIKYRSLEFAQGVTQDTLGRIVGAQRKGWETSQVRRITEDGALRDVEGGTARDAVREYSLPNLSDPDYLQILKLRIACNFTQSGSIPELTSVIKEIVGITAVVQYAGPGAIDLVVSPDTPAATVSLLLRKNSTERGDDIFIFPYPATTQVRVTYNNYRLTENGVQRIAEDATARITENIPL